MSEKIKPDSYFANWPESLSAAAIGLRSPVLAAAPDLHEVIKWGSPVNEPNQSVIWIKPQKKHITFGSFRGAELAFADPEGSLEEPATPCSSSVEAAAEPSVRHLIEAAFQLDGGTREN